MRVGIGTLLAVPDLVDLVPADLCDLPRAISRFLAVTLRANQYKTSIYRAEIARIMVAVDQARLTAAALNGIAAESSRYGGRGARQFSDLDVLLSPEDITVARTILTDLAITARSRPTTAGPGRTRRAPALPGSFHLTQDSHSW